MKKNNSQKIIVIGDVIFDQYMYADNLSVSPEAPVLKFLYKNQEVRLGGAANVALNLSVLGSCVEFYSLIDIKYKKQFESLFLNKNLLNKVTFLKNYQNSLKTRYIANNKHIIRIDNEPDLNILKKLKRNFLKKINLRLKKDDFDKIIISNYNKGLFDDNLLKIIFNLADKKKIIVDSKSFDLKLYKKSYIFKPNLNEFKKICSHYNFDKDINKAAFQVITKFKFDNLLITRGGEGMTLYCKNRKSYHFDVFSHQVNDVTGAGDIVLSSVAHFLNVEDTIFEAIEKSSFLASHSVKELGTTTISPTHIEQLNSNFCEKFIDNEDLKNLIHSIRNKKVIMTNGCFDILHPGHIHLFKEAKRLGDILIVAINEDESVKKIKNFSRPYYTLKDRIFVLNGIRYIDYIVKFKEKTPIKLIRKIKPNILVKGSDYKASEVVGYDYLKSIGSKVKTIKLLKNYSTTNILKKAKII